MNQQRRLDLDRYRRMKERGRASPRVGESSLCFSAPEIESEPRPTKPSRNNYDYREVPPSPERSNVLSSRIVCGMLGSNNKIPETLSPPPTLYDEARRRRFDKFRSRSRQSPNSSGTSPFIYTSPSAPSSSSSPRIPPGHQPDEGMPKVRTSFTKKYRPVDPPIRGRSDPPTVGSLRQPIVLEEEDFVSMQQKIMALPYPGSPSLACSPNSLIDVTPPIPPGRDASPSRSASSGSTARRDRIEESRGRNDDTRDQAAETVETPPGDRIETSRDSPTSDSLEFRHSLEMPSLHSRYSMETVSRRSFDGLTQASIPVDIRRRPPVGHGNQRREVKSEEKDLTKGFKSLTVETVSRRNFDGLTQASIDIRCRLPVGHGNQQREVKSEEKDLTNGFKPLTVEDSYKKPRKDVQIYRIESPRAMAPSLDQQTVRLLYSKEFSEMIKERQSRQTEEPLFDHQNENSLPHQSNVRGVSYVVRKRPIFETEIERGDFDVVNAETGQSDTIAVYQTRLMPDRSTKDLTVVPFRCDSVVSEQATSEEFYIRVGQHNVLTAKNGGYATFVIYGGSGSGKTSTMTDIEERAAYDIFESDASTETKSLGKSTVVSVQYVELCGNQCFDLLGSIGSFVRVVEKEGGSYQFKGATTKTASNVRELLMLLSEAKRRLATQAAIRKHAEGHIYVLCQIVIHQEGHRGCLNLLECSATEYNSYQKASTDSSVTTSFDVLMECIRARASGRLSDCPFKTSNNVTKILHGSFESPNSRVCLLATVSPNATATESTLSTLSSLQKVMSGYLENRESKLQSSPRNDETSAEDLVLPRQWSPSELASWMTKKKLLGNPVPSDVNGRFAMRMTKRQLKNMFYGVLDDAKAAKLFIALRAENDRIARIRVKRRIARGLQEVSY